MALAAPRGNSGSGRSPDGANIDPSPMTRIRPIQLLAALAASCFPLVGSDALAQDEERPLWEQEAMLLYSESSSDFTRLRMLGQKNPRLAAYTRALEILHGARQTEDELAPYLEAQNQFRLLVAEIDDDPVGLASHYYLARIAQSNPVELDLQAAKQLYLDLFEAHPDHFFGQMAFIKFATIEIYDEPEGHQRSAAQRLAAIEKQVPAITFPDMARNLRRILGEGYHALGVDPRKAFEHLDAACAMGQPVASIRAETLESLAEVAQAIGETERALRAYEELQLLDPRGPNATRYADEARRLRAELVNAAPPR